MMNLITNNIDIWISSQKKRNTVGRGSGSKIEFYGINKLRDLILDLAVQGKLIPQDSKDEPASELLRKVEEEKKQLVKAGKLKNQKKVEKIDYIDMPIETPIGWEWALIPQVIKFDKYAIKRGPFGSSIKKDFFVPSGYKVYEQQHAIYDDFSLGQYYVDDKKFEELKAFEVNPNDIIISCSGTVGKVAIAPDWMEPGIINQALLKLSLNQNILINDYFKILFPAFYMKTDTLSNLKGTAQKNMVSVATLKSEPFPLPPIAEQVRIVKKVDELMDLCDQLEQEEMGSKTTHLTLVKTLLNTLTSVETEEEFTKSWQQLSEHFDILFTTEESVEELKQAIFQLAVMGKLLQQDPNDEPASELVNKIKKEKEILVEEKKIRKQKPLPIISNDEKPYNLPKSWEWCRLGNTGIGSTGKTPSTKESKYFNGEIPFIGPGQITPAGKLIRPDKFLTEEGLRNSTEALNGDILMVCIGGSIGKSVICDKRISFNQQINAIKPIYISSQFLHITVSTNSFYQSVLEKAAGSATPIINRMKWEELLVPIAPLNEQNRIVQKVNELLFLCDSLKENITKIQNTQLLLADAIVEKAI